MKKTTIFVLLVLYSLLSFSQQELTMYYMPGVGQSANVNPSLIPYNRISIGLPVISSTSLLLSNTFVYHDVYKKRSDDSVVIDVDNMIQHMKKNSLLTASMNTDLFSLGLVFGKSFFHFNVTERVNISFSYSKDLFELIEKGNGPFIGQKLDFSNTGFDASHFREYGISFARPVNDRLQVGGKLKYLYGMENFSTHNGNLGLYTSADDYGLEVPVNITVNSSAQVNSTDGFSKMNISSYLFGKKNRGFGVDLGATFEVNNKISLSASLIDLGYINWNTDVKSYSINAGTYQFNGIDIKKLLVDSSQSSQAMLDSMSASFKTVESNSGYKTTLPAHAYLGMKYTLGKKCYIGTLLHAEFISGTIQPSATVSLNSQFGKHLSLSTGYSYINNHFNNMNAGLAVTAGPIQIYAASDNILGILHPLDYNTAHMHFGINLLFGRGASHHFGNTNYSSGSGRSSHKSGSKGKASMSAVKDRDGDGIPDELDFCPDEPGLVQFDGCPDTDGDGVQDLFDNCPTEAGPIYNRGCPTDKKDTQVAPPEKE